MINQNSNPWENMNPGSQRRVEFDTNHDYFWILDMHCKFGFYMKLDISSKIVRDIQLKGVDIRIERSTGGSTEFYLALENKEDWEIFHILCYDLITVIDTYESDEKKMSMLFYRLEKWKNLLANRRQLSVSKEKQMGIFSELQCMSNLISPHVGLCDALNAWVGMEMDKQDFGLKDCAIEVKSHQATKGNVAYISSLQQLFTEKDKLFLASYGLTSSQNGISIDDLYDQIVEYATTTEQETLLMKLFEYGWIPHNDKFYKEKFVIDSESIYEVREGFPILNPEFIDFRIIEVKYKIDLSKCEDYIVDSADIFGGE